MLGLAIESADRTASAALWRSGGPGGSTGGDCRVIAAGALPPEAGKADQLITVIDALLAEQSIAYDQLDLIAVNRGPGSFTGIRSAVALARGLALAADRPVLGVTSHQALAVMLKREAADRPLLIALDARRGEVYAQAFDVDGAPLGEIDAVAPAEVADRLGHGAWRLAGSGAALVASHLSEAADIEYVEARPADAGAVAYAAAAALSAGDAPQKGFALRPLYVRAPDAVPPAPLIVAASDREVSA